MNGWTTGVTWTFCLDERGVIPAMWTDLGKSGRSSAKIEGGDLDGAQAVAGIRSDGTVQGASSPG